MVNTPGAATVIAGRFETDGVAYWLKSVCALPPSTTLSEAVPVLVG